MSIRVPDLIGGIIFLLMSLVFWSQTNDPSFEGLEAARNPVWYPRLLLLLTGMASVVLILRSFTGKGIETPRPNFTRLCVITILLAVYFFMFEQAGFIPASIVLIPILSWILGYRRIGITLSVSVIFTVVIWYVFAEVFIVRPPGIGIDILLDVARGA
ncbi:MAG: hypothetical protein ACJA2D_001778 [Pseudohongiellaceae bacterium]|jgi:hypothetical protein